MRREREKLRGRDMRMRGIVMSDLIFKNIFKMF